MDAKKPRKSSKSVTLTLVPLMASTALLFGCRNEQPGAERRACVDNEGHVVDDSRCATPGFYHWYAYHYSGTYDPYRYRPGHVVFVPFISPTPAARSNSDSMSHSGKASRGGFGSSAVSHGSVGA